MKSKKLWITLGIIFAVVLIVLTTVFCIRMRKPKYSYAQINEAFWIGVIGEDKYHYVDINSRLPQFNEDTAWIINLYNDHLIENGKTSEDFLSLDEVLDFYSSEYDENGKPKINNLPKKIEKYLDWYYRPFKRFPKVDEELAKKESTISCAMFGLGVYSERKYTQQLSDVKIDDYWKFYTGIYVFNKNHPSEMITEDEIKMAMVGGPQESLIRFGEWFIYLDGEDTVSEYKLDLYVAYKHYSEDKYGYYSDDDPNVSYHDLGPTEIKQFLEYIESTKE